MAASTLAIAAPRPREAPVTMVRQRGVSGRSGAARGMGAGASAPHSGSRDAAVSSLELVKFASIGNALNGWLANGRKIAGKCAAVDIALGDSLK